MSKELVLVNMSKETEIGTVYVKWDSSTGKKAQRYAAQLKQIRSDVPNDINDVTVLDPQVILLMETLGFSKEDAIKQATRWYLDELSTYISIGQTLAILSDNFKVEMDAGKLSVTSENLQLPETLPDEYYDLTDENNERMLIGRIPYSERRYNVPVEKIILYVNYIINEHWPEMLSDIKNNLTDNVYDEFQRELQKIEREGIESGAVNVLPEDITPEMDDEGFHTE